MLAVDVVGDRWRVFLQRWGETAEDFVSVVEFGR
jgi:hypothetical protein